MIIANPIYDVTFKRLLENDRVAKFLIGTILDCKVISLTPKIQERSRIDEGTGKLTLLRKDFAATIETEEEGRRNVIIEMQKTLHLGDIYRFKNYLGEEYKNSALPIISIYILGFNLSIDSPAFVARPDCIDLQTNEKITKKDGFVELLTHRAYFIQTRRIKPSVNTRLEKLLSIFEQANFIGNSTKTKDYLLAVDDPEIKAVLDMLRYVAADKTTREALDEEEYYQQAMNGIFGEKDRELIKTKGDLDQTKEDLSLTKENLEQTKEDLEQTKEDLEQTKEDLIQTREEWYQTKEDLEQANEKIAQRERDVEELRKMIEALKTDGRII